MAKQPIKKINPLDRNVVPGVGLDKNIYVKSGDYNQLVTRVNENTVDIEAILAGNTFQGTIDCSTNPNYPAATENYWWVVSVAGKIGGVAGPSVDVGDMIICNETNAGGTHAAVGTKFNILEHNIDLGTIPAPTARTFSPIVSADPLGENVGYLDAAIGGDVTPAVRTVGPVSAGQSVNDNVDALDAAIGQDEAPLGRTSNPIDMSQSVLANIGLLDKAIGSDADLAPVYDITVGNTIYSMLHSVDSANYNQDLNLGLGVYSFGAIDNLIFTAREPGSAGNGITIIAQDTGGTPGTIVVNPIDRTITIEILDGVTLDTLIENAVNQDPIASLLVFCVGSTGNPLNVAVTITSGGIESQTFSYIRDNFINGAQFGIYLLQPTMRNAITVLDKILNVVYNRTEHLNIVPYDTSSYTKNTNMVSAKYDFATMGGIAGVIQLNGGVPVIPSGAIILRTFVDIQDGIVPDGGTIANIQIGANLVTNNIAGAPAVIIPGLQNGPSVPGVFKVGANSTIDLNIAGGAGLTAGEFRVFVEYVISD